MAQTDTNLKKDTRFAGGYINVKLEEDPDLLNDPVIISHVDGDGLCGAAVVHYYLNHINEGRDFTVPLEDRAICIYNYGQPTDRAEAICEAHHGLIFMTDMTLPEEFMQKYAPRIVWMDHHQSSIEASKEQGWRDKLFFCGAREEAGDFAEYLTCSINDQTHIVPPKGKISGCENAYVHLFRPNLPDKKYVIPLIVHYCGRYDIWDLYRDRILDVETYMRTYVYNKQPYPLSAIRTIIDLFDIEYGSFLRDPEDVDAWLASSKLQELENIVREGASLQKHKAAFDYNDVKRDGCIVLHTPENKDLRCWLFLINRPNVNSLFYEGWFNEIKRELHKKGPYTCIGCSFKYTIQHGIWTFGFYDLGQTSKALDVMEDLVKTLDAEGAKCITHGGHPNACGCSFKNIQPFFELLKRYEPLKIED